MKKDSDISYKMFFTDKKNPFQECTDDEWKIMFHEGCRGFPMCKKKEYADSYCAMWSGEWKESYECVESVYGSIYNFLKEMDKRKARLARKLQKNK